MSESARSCTAPEVNMGFDTLGDMMDKWVEDIRKGT